MASAERTSIYVSIISEHVLENDLIAMQLRSPVIMLISCHADEADATTRQQI